ncbi:MAG: hypothetical protein ACKV1O_02385 [Saprospiraceae bacterium]
MVSMDDLMGQVFANARFDNIRGVQLGVNPSEIEQIEKRKGEKDVYFINYFIPIVSFGSIEVNYQCYNPNVIDKITLFLSADLANQEAIETFDAFSKELSYRLDSELGKPKKEKHKGDVNIEPTTYWVNNSAIPPLEIIKFVYYDDLSGGNNKIVKIILRYYEPD